MDVKDETELVAEVESYIERLMSRAEVHQAYAMLRSTGCEDIAVMVFYDEDVVAMPRPDLVASLREMAPNFPGLDIATVADTVARGRAMALSHGAFWLVAVREIGDDVTVEAVAVGVTRGARARA